jgi:hypothetical protein
VTTGRFDDLARTLATPMPRRQALHLAAGVAITAVVAGLRPGAAPATGSRSAEQCPPGGQQTCEEQFPGNGKMDCCKIAKSTNYQCCRAGKCCGGPCCAKDEFCIDLRCIPGCKFDHPILGPEVRRYDPKTQCCTPFGVQPKLEDFSARYCKETLTKRPKSEKYKPTKNGCGSKDFDVPDTWPAKGPGKKANFTPSCNKHDVCYGTCKKDKDACDKAFCSDLRKACAKTWPNAGDSKRAGCETRADFYCAGVILAGDSAYWNAQAEGCHCCK